MEAITTYFNSIGMDFSSFLIAVGVLLIGSILIGAVGRFVFGKRSILVDSVSSAIGILFVYALNIVLHSAQTQWQQFITPLPFITVLGDELTLFSYSGAELTAICGELVSLIILAFLMNVIDRFMPKGKNIFTWLFFRILTVLLAQAAHLFVIWLLGTYLPEGFLTYAPIIILCLLVLMLITGALKILVGALISTVNPLIAALYTFFFANIVGKQVTKAIFTTAILAGLVFALEKLGISIICIALGALSAYIPFALLLLVVWYLVNKIFK